ncbi:MAG: HslU--HslV peptidase ATPase subunit, partial [Holosporaceae bacterium]|nr:HslU--HslV peptidase ATPase subunit [Holosporaceae bacterium]
TEDDFVRILLETETSLIKQYKALLKIEGVELQFSDDSIRKIAGVAAIVNRSIENIGARRLHTVIEKLLEDISFNADKKSGETVLIDTKYVEEKVGELAEQRDISMYIL